MSKYRQKTKWRTQPDGFTLVEILVVISIISILMSILLPTLSNAREQGRRVDCMSNLKQFTLAWNLYAMDNDDKLCSPDTGWNDGSCGESNNWVADGVALPGNDIGGHEQAIMDGVIWPYVGGAIQLFDCKSTRGNTSVYNWSSRLRDYSISNTMGGGCGAVFKGLADIVRPAEKMVFIDADGGLCASPNDFRFFWLVGPFKPFELKEGEPEWSFPRNPDGWPLSIITARHNNGCNLSFADGHCEFWKWKDPRTIQLANRQISESKASDDNPDLERMVQLLKVR